MGEICDEVESREWYLASYASEGVPTSDHLKLRTVRLSLAADAIPDGHLALELLFVSIDPYLRSRMTGLLDGLHSDPYQLNQVITAFGIGKVVRSKNSEFEEGDIVLHPFIPVAEYCVVKSHMFKKIDPNTAISLPDFLSCLGVPGFAAWVGIEVLAEPKPGSNVFISAASGGVGMFAGQLAKLRGCRVIGSTGSDDKVKLIKEEFGYDDGFNYHKETDYDAALSRYFPNGIDVYVDNVGGKMLEAVLNHVNKFARIPLCGMISQYNKVWREREGVRNLLNMVGKEVRMEGFMVRSHLHRFGEFAAAMEGYMKQGKVKSRNKINLGIHSFLDSLASVFSSSNDGKVIIQVKPRV
ncbi:2-alkenal reductase (NADP(+)-dependent)-like [Neltuma alba]|uniref:2-alkenal reductase (NADP(+)-dependent)-like n=1 Tax=Neltuma alba TaxID=207710 RepID=UPI0010A37FFA|nr:2-alkenal reductase (NADP(+)-dependent)-like [Prosopis alba]XP_028785703.1 2-alkenal reductase (NADP(+)-dependent)-like [Prosopis alba]